MTFKSALGVRDVAAWAPLDRLLVETDSPFLAPVPLRGKRCEPAHVVPIATIMRRWVVGAHRASARGRDAPRKAERLYAYLASETFRGDFLAIVECARVEEVFQRPMHEYTRKLIAAIPRPPSALSSAAGPLPLVAAQ